MNQEDVNSRKKELRKIVKERKKTFSPDNAIVDSTKIFDRVELLPQFKGAKVVLAYWSLSDEVITHGFILKWADKKKIVLPIIVGDTLELRVFCGIEELIKNDGFGIHEPMAGELVDPMDVDFAIIPGVAFDKNGNRLGRGKGFYDRFLKRTRAYKVAVGYDFQIFDKIPVASFDIPVDIVLSTNN